MITGDPTDEVQLAIPRVV
jgi:hypothetical protein